MDTLLYYWDNVVDFFSHSRPHSAITWIPFGVLMVFALFFCIMGFASFAIGTIGLVLLVWLIRYDDFSMVERIVAVVVTIALFSVATFALYTGEASAREIDAVQVVIRQLPKDVTVDDEENIVKVREVYDLLSDEQKSRVATDYYDYLVSREEALAEAKEKVELEKQRQAQLDEYDEAVSDAKEKARLVELNESSTKVDEKEKEAAQLKQDQALRTQVVALNQWWTNTYMEETLFPNTLSCVKEFKVENGKLKVFINEKKFEETKKSKKELMDRIGLSLCLYPEKIVANNWNSETDLELQNDDLVMV